MGAGRGAVEEEGGGDNIEEGERDDENLPSPSDEKDSIIESLKMQNGDLLAQIEILKNELKASNGGSLPKTISKLLEARREDVIYNAQ